MTKNLITDNSYSSLEVHEIDYTKETVIPIK